MTTQPSLKPEPLDAESTMQTVRKLHLPQPPWSAFCPLLYFPQISFKFFIYGKSHLPNCKNSCRISWGPFFSLSRSWSLLALSCSTNSFRDKWFHISVVVFVVIIVGTFCTTASQLSSYVQTSPTFTLQITKFRFFLLFSFILCTSPAEYRFK